MIESSVGATAAAHLAPLCDYVDLDGPLLIKNDPYRGLKYDGAKMTLPDAPGFGLERLWGASFLHLRKHRTDFLHISAILFSKLFDH